MKNQCKDIDLAKNREISVFKTKVQEDIEEVKSGYEKQMVRYSENKSKLEQAIKDKDARYNKLVMEMSNRVQKIKELEIQISLHEINKKKEAEQSKNFLDTIDGLEGQVIHMNNMLSPLT